MTDKQIIINNFNFEEWFNYNNKLIQDLKEKIFSKEQEVDVLKAENEKLEEQLELNTANAVVIDMAQRLYKLKQILAEIKDCFDNYKKEQDYLSFVSELNQILRKCEVE